MVAKEIKKHLQPSKNTLKISEIIEQLAKKNIKTGMSIDSFGKLLSKHGFKHNSRAWFIELKTGDNKSQ